MSTRKTLSHSRIEYRQLVMPNHTNALGTLFGGMMMSWLDEACAMCAQKHSNSIVVTVHMDDISFKKPVHLGDQVKIIAEVSYTGSSSIEIKACAFRENPIKDEEELCVTAFMTFVALDGNGKKLRVPKIIGETPEEIEKLESRKKDKSK